MGRPSLRSAHLTALMVFSLFAIFGLIASGYSRLLFLTMPFVGLFLWAQRMRRVIDRCDPDMEIPGDLN
jgi:hypothetical protein